MVLTEREPLLANENPPVEESESNDDNDSIFGSRGHIEENYTTQNQDGVRRLSFKEKFGYGLGHILNDLCSAMWFTYLLLYFHKVLSFKNIYAGIVLFVGQIADGLSTPFVGYYSDKGDDMFLCNRYGKRKSWHLVGTMSVLFSFPFIFLPSIDASTTNAWAQMFYYCAFVIIFQFGWAATQISHMSMIPDITPCANERTALTAIRYGATVGSNITIYLVTWIFLGIGNDGLIGPNDATAFRNIMLVAICLGTFCSLSFHWLLKLENSDENRLNGQGPVLNRMFATDWFKEPQFYIVAVIYMCTRLVVNLSQAYIPLYVQTTLQLHASYVAIIPLTMYIFGLVASGIMTPINNKIGRKQTFILGCVIICTSCIWIKIGCSMESSYKIYQIFGIAGLLGIGCSTMLITSLSLTADLISNNIESSAFVYGAMSLTDKLSNGIAVVLIQNFIPTNTDTCPLCRLYFRDILFYFCGISAIISAIFVLLLIKFPLGQRWRARNYEILRQNYEEISGINQSEPTI